MNKELGQLIQRAANAMSAEQTIVGGLASDTPRFALFHAAASICSQKVRCVLAYHRIPYSSHLVDIFAGETYQPDYIRLRMLGCIAQGGALASHHSGSTAARSEGFDGAVVPTLVDLTGGQIVVDSRAICTWLDTLAIRGQSLRPPLLATAIDRELAIVDELPNYQLLMGRSQSADGSLPDEEAMAAFSRRKVGMCDELIARYPDDPAIVAACSAKRAKELSAAEQLFTSEAMERARWAIEAALIRLDGALANSLGPFLFGAAPTLADLMWAIEIIRIKDVGQVRIWGDEYLPHIAAFEMAASSLPAIRAAVLDWPGALLRPVNTNSNLETSC